MFEISKAIKKIETSFVQNERNDLTRNEKLISFLACAKYTYHPTENNQVIIRIDEALPFFPEWDANLSDADYKALIFGIIKAVRDRSWWLYVGQGKYATVSYFKEAEWDSQNNYFKIELDKRLVKYLRIDHAQGRFSQYNLLNLSKMKPKYSITLYDYLKSVSNNSRWTFEVGTGSNNDIFNVLADWPSCRKEEEPEGLVENIPEPKIPKYWFKTFKQFEETILKPVVRDINQYTDLEVDYTISKLDKNNKKTRSVKFITFLIKKKGISEKKLLEIEQLKELEKYNERDSKKLIDKKELQFIKECDESESIALEEILERQAREVTPIREKALKSKYPEIYEIICGYPECCTPTHLDTLVDVSVENGKLNFLKNEYKLEFAKLYIEYYSEKLKDCTSDTKTSSYLRLKDLLSKDYDNYAEKLMQSKRYAYFKDYQLQESILEKTKLENDPDYAERKRIWDLLTNN